MLRNSRTRVRHGRLFLAVGKTTLPDGKKHNWLIFFETPTWWAGRAEEVARGLNEGKTKMHL
jgi:hypothetical protein